ncbi:MAG: glycosyltransferase family 4 protein [Chitinispirillaceae bacterium]|nr:glycosyltransferase family 4 protein [Chitinispirillaceae bacterium]
MKPLRICHVITRLDKGGSAENTLLTVLGNLAHGHRVEVVCGVSDLPPSENEERARRHGAVITRLNSLVRELSPLNDCMAVLQLYFYLRKHPCDVLHTHTSKAGIVARIAGVLAGVRCIIHTPHGHIFYGYFSPLVTRIFVAVERLVTFRTAALITLTEAERRDYLVRRIGTPESIFPILSGIDLAPYLRTDIDRAAARREAGLPPDKYIAGTVARLDPVKNHDLIISAAQLLKGRIPALMFVFAGDGSLRGHLADRIEQAGLSDRFLLLGWRNDTPRLLRAFDLFVMCSRNEGMGRAFVEAQASGLPVIGSRVGGIPEVMMEGVTGYMVPPDDPHALAERIDKLYNNRNDAPAVAQRCHEWINPRFGSEAMVDALEVVYARFTGNGDGTGC